MLYPLLLLLKFCSVLAFAGGATAAFAAESSEMRKQAVHRVASPALLGVWVFGYLLTLEIGVALFELWIVGGFLFSVLAQGALEHVAATGARGPAARVRVALPIVAALAMMVYRPCWSAWFP